MSPSESGLSRRKFLKTTAAGAAATALAPAAIGSPRSSETLVTGLHQTLTPEQRRTIAFPFDHPLRSKIDNNWHITPPRIGEFFNPSQRKLIGDIFRGLHNPEFVDRVMTHLQ